jgi:hypothetical protein
LRAGKATPSVRTAYDVLNGRIHVVLHLFLPWRFGAISALCWRWVLYTAKVLYEWTVVLMMQKRKWRFFSVS